MQHVFITRLEDADKDYAERWEPFYKKIDEAVVPCNKRLLDAFRAKKMNVAFAKVISHKKDGSDRSLDQKGSGYNAVHVMEDEWLGEIVPELAPQGDDLIVRKSTDSAVTGTNLRLLFSNMGIDTVVVTGVLTDQCVSSTVRSLADESFKVWLVEDACMAATELIHNNELEILNNIYCHVVNTDEILAAL